MSGTLEQALHAAAEPLHAPGKVTWQVISPARLAAIAAARALPGWQVEIAALEAEVVPLLYLRNVGRYAIEGQLTLLRSTVTAVGMGAPLRKCLENLAALGVGRLRILVPERQAPDARRQAPGGTGSHSRPLAGQPQATDSATLASGVWRLASDLAAAVTRQNGSLEVSADTVALQRGDPTSAMGEPDVIVSCVEEVVEEMLLQTVCRRLEVPLVVGGLQDEAGQVTTILPGDPGVALIYQNDHPHLDRSRPGSLEADGYHPMLLGTWLADQVITLRLGTGELLQNRLLYADMRSGKARTFPLGRPPA